MRKKPFICLLVFIGFFSSSCKKQPPPTTESLIEAAKAGDVAGVKNALEAKIDVNSQDDRGCTALYWAARTGRTDVAEMLIESKADLDRKYAKDRSMTALIIAAEMGHLKVVNLLIKANANLNAKDQYGATALHWAVTNARANWAPIEGRMEVVKALINAKADLNIRNNRGGTALMTAAYYRYDDVVRLLRESGAK